MERILHEYFWYLLRHTYKWWPDAIWLRVLYRLKMHRVLHLKNPQRFTEKLQWLKLHDRNPLYSVLVDKYEVKDYVRQQIGGEYVIPVYGVWEHFDDIDFEKLPNQFVLKCTHDSGNVFICKDKVTFDKTKAKEGLERSLKYNFYWWTREWPYKNVKARILAEKYMKDEKSGDGSLTDYKFYCFKGEPKIVLVSSGRGSGNLCFDYYDMQWRKLPLIWDRPNSNIDYAEPLNFSKMQQMCRQLAQGIPHVRIDLYDISNHIYFGEFTFYDSGGYCNFTPDEWDKKLGDMISVPV